MCAPLANSQMSLSALHATMSCCIAGIAGIREIVTKATEPSSPSNPSDRFCLPPLESNSITICCPENSQGSMALERVLLSRLALHDALAHYAATRRGAHSHKLCTASFFTKSHWRGSSLQRGLRLASHFSRVFRSDAFARPEQRSTPA